MNDSRYCLVLSSLWRLVDLFLGRFSPSGSAAPDYWVQGMDLCKKHNDGSSLLVSCEVSFRSPRKFCQFFVISWGLVPLSLGGRVLLGKVHGLTPGQCNCQHLFAIVADSQKVYNRIFWRVEVLNPQTTEELTFLRKAMSKWTQTSVFQPQFNRLVSIKFDNPFVNVIILLIGF